LQPRWFDTPIRNPRKPLPMDKALEILIQDNEISADAFPMPVRSMNHHPDPFVPSAICWHAAGSLHCPADSNLLGLSMIWIPIGFDPEGSPATGTKLNLSFH
ncbi:MAG: hypothetical protein KJ645_10260, partial [Planctomycetes bacterium]|nr:hypothetical protein [Planctomycetota bacterium]